MALGCINRTEWGTKLPPMAVLASLVDNIMQFMSLTEGTALLFVSEVVLYPAFSSPPTHPPTHPP